ncbi:MAG TPA: MaoC family dehydratase [Acetobacteraceae bacterium]|jgi:acyl dehydratase|nr:MaoC family dehydratase [Acetobacteraceae bacterium]
MSETLHLEDLTPGRRFRLGTLQVSAAGIAAFAAEFDPQPFHLDAAAARLSPFGGLAASGWHTAALTMRLLVRDLPLAGGIVGLGLDVLRWPAPVRPGDTLSAEVEVLEARPSRSRPGSGVVKLRVTTRQQDGKTVQEMVPNLIVPSRSA